MRNVSTHITLAEATKSDTATRKGIDNIPTEEHFANMQHVANTIFEPLRDFFGKPIAVTSFYRSPKLNKAIGGASTSQHCNGEAMDIDGDVFGGVSNKSIFAWIKNNCKFDQLILEFVGADGTGGWVHVSLKRNVENRNQILVASKDAKGKTIYTPYK